MVVAAVAAVWLMIEHDAALAPAVDESGTGIVAFEFAGSPDRAEEILDSWGRAGRAGAEQAIKIDYGFLVAYSVLLALATAAIAERSTGPAARAGWWLSGLALVAGGLDAIENTLLLRVVDGYHSGSIGGTATTWAAVAAGIKFAIVIVAGLYVLFGLIRMWGWPRKSQVDPGARTA